MVLFQSRVSGWRPSLLLVWVLCLRTRAVASSSSTSSSSSTLILDDYGNAVQLQHAQKAAQQHGSLVVVLDQPNGEIWVVSLADSGSNEQNEGKHSHLRCRPSRSAPKDNLDDSNEPQQRIGRAYEGQHHFLQPLIHSFSHSFVEERDRHPREVNSVALVSVGVQADAVWLLGKLQAYATRLWDRTNAKLSVPAVLQAASTLVQTCATRYPQVHNAYGASLELLLQEDEEEDKRQKRQQSWARPLGLCSFILDLSVPQSVREKTPRIFRLDPSGLIQPVRTQMACLGRHSAELEYWWQTHVSQDMAEEDPLLQKEHSSDTDLCQRLHQGLSQVLSQAPSGLRLEIWSPETRAIQRRIVLFDRDLAQEVVTTNK